jgi:lipid II isoglutaminyl synthase (glutamine-hydrolysing)
MSRALTSALLSFPRRLAAVNGAKLSAALSRFLGRGGGTALPGLVAGFIDRDLVRDLSRQLGRGAVLVSGTNGKTTTCRMIASILTSAGINVVRNGSGSNLTRGLAASLVGRSNYMGTLTGARDLLGLFEVDEAALPDVLRTILPERVVLLNLFRDQLDRYGEVATVARIWRNALTGLREGAVLIVNADDPLLIELTNGLDTPRFTFGIASAERTLATREHASDVKACPHCGGEIAYTMRFLGHLGHFACTQCDLRRPTPDVEAAHVRLDGITGSSYVVTHGEDTIRISLPLPGLYNMYNALGAACTAISLGLPSSALIAGLATVRPAFGRMERVLVNGCTVVLALAKNPAGLNEVVRTIAGESERLHLLVLLNDNAADGHDVSWIWDADIEGLAGRVAAVTFSGTRAEDMALRFKYAGVLESKPTIQWEILRDTDSALQAAVASTPFDGTLFVVPTYTALLDVRNILSRQGYARSYWEEE